MKRILLMVFVLTVLMSALAAAEQSPVTFADLIVDLVEAYESPTAGSFLKIDVDVESLQDEIAASIAESWKTVYLDPDYQLLIYGKDDPTRLQIPENGRDHAIVIFGYELLNGEMTDELLLRQLNVAKKIRRTKGWIARKRKEAMPEHRRLTMTKQPALWTSRFWQYLVAGVIKGRCEAGAAVAKTYPASMLVCTGGATGENNPDQHTEAGLMKDYLVRMCGLEAGRILTDDRALTTVDNALNSFAIMQAKGIRTMTIVTSSYHQRRGQTLYNAVGAQYKKEHSYLIGIVGNYSFETKPSADFYRMDEVMSAFHLGIVLNLPEEEKAAISASLSKYMPARPTQKPE